MFFQVFGEDEDVVHVYAYDAVADEVFKNVIHHSLEGGWAVSHAIQHYQWFKQPVLYSPPQVLRDSSGSPQTPQRILRESSKSLQISQKVLRKSLEKCKDSLRTPQDVLRDLSRTCQ
jgi:hypothetical protein